MAFVPATVTHEPVFSPSQCGEIITANSTGFKQVGTSQDKRLNEKVRKASALPLTLDKHSNIYKATIPVALGVNKQIWKYVLDTHDDIQLLKYVPGDHYTWHMDIGSGSHENRKLSFIISLSPTESYEGGEVIFKAGSEEKSFKLEQGKMILFPSFVLHKVATVTKGERYVLVGWLRGEKPFV